MCSQRGDVCDQRLVRGFSQLLLLYCSIWSWRGNLLFMLRSEVLDALKYFGLYKFASCVGSDPLLLVHGLHRSEEVDWDKKTVKDGFLFYEFSLVMSTLLARRLRKRRSPWEVLMALRRRWRWQPFWWPSVVRYRMLTWHRFGRTMMLIASKVVIKVKPGVRD